MKRTPLLIAVAAAMLLFASCKNGANTGVSIPKDAAIAVHINSASLSSKLSWQEIKATNWFKEMYQQTKDSLAQRLLDNPEVSGIDVKSDFAFFMKKQGKGGYGVFEGNIKDPVAFETFLRKTNKNGQAKKEGDWYYMNNDQENLVSWNNQKFAVIIDMPTLGQTSPYTYTSTGDNRFPADSLKKFVTETLTLKGSNSLTGDERFADLIKQNGDVHLWMNSERLYSGMVGGIMSLMKMNILFEGNVSASALNFDDGKITMKTKQYYGKEMTDLIKKYEPKPVTADVINRIPSQNVIGAFVMNYPPEGVKAFLQLAGFDGMANAFLGKYNSSLDELMKAYKGQMLVAATDLQVKQEKQTFQGTDYTYTSTKPDCKVLFALSVNDKASFDKLINIAQNQINTQGGQQLLSKINYKVNNDWFAISNSTEAVDKFLAGGNNNVSFADKISGHPFGMYIDIQKIMKASQPAVTEASSLSALDASMKLWQDVTMTGGEYKDGAVTADFVISLVDKKTNSLKQINQYVEQLAALKKKQQENLSNILIDSAAASVDTTATAQ